VSDQFAGRTGPCPNCKTPIRIPTPQPEVKIHAPEPVSKVASSGGEHLVIKPIAHRDMKWRAGVAAAIAGGWLAVLLAAYLARDILKPSVWLRGIGLLLVSPELVAGGYAFLRDDEVEPYRGRPLRLRAGILAAIFALLWGIYSFVVRGGVGDELWTWFVVVPPFLVIGALAAHACLDLDFDNALVLYGFYLVATMLLGWAAGMGWPWQAADVAPPPG
jgi:hypothetical protein